MESAASTTRICEDGDSSRRCGAKFADFLRNNRRAAILGLGCSIGVVCIMAAVLVGTHSIAGPCFAGTAPTRDICKTDSCQAIAQRLQQSMNESLDPCDDFYLFACQRWDRERNESIWEAASNRSLEDFEAAKTALLDGHFKPTNEPEAYLVDFVRHCENEHPRRTVEGKDPVILELNIMGGYPLFLPQWRAEGYDWLRAEARLAHVGHNQALLSVRFQIDGQRRDRRIIQLDTQSSMFPPQLLGNATAVNGLKGFLRTVATQYRYPDGGNISWENDAWMKDINLQIEEMLQFANSLNEQLKPYHSMPEQGVSRMTIQELRKAITEVDWLNYIRLLTSPGFGIDMSPVYIADTDVVLVRNVDRLRALAKFMEKKQQTRAVANYIGYKSLINTVYFSPREQVLETYYEYMSQHGLNFNRTEKCREIAESMRLVLYHHYFRINKARLEKQRALTKHMLKQAKAQFGLTIRAASWIGQHAKELLLRKLERVKALVGYTDWLLNPDNLWDFYAMRGAPNSTKPFLRRLTYHRIKKYSQQIQELTSPREPEIWEDITTVVNAAYNIRDVNVKVYAGMLQQPFLYLDAPTYVNYGTVGFVAGHEIIHAFDDRGITIDEHGVDFKSDEWERATREEFDRRMQSIIDLYTTRFQVNGSHTRNENLPDMTAAGISFRSYKIDPESQNAPALPGLERYTNDQLYFLSFASIWCNNNGYDPTSIYSPHHARVNGPLMNLAEFAQAFRCPADTNMNPKDKKAVWAT